MYKIVIMEDEAASSEYLVNIINQKCPRFQVVGVAEDGEEGIELVKKYLPDVVFTDIRMPRMDGIQVSAVMKNEFPNIQTVIVSGFQEFEYAKSALQHGVIDYLLKPVKVSQVVELLEKIYEALESEYLEKQKKIISKYILGQGVSDSYRNHYLIHKKFHIALLRRRGLIGRFISSHDSELMMNPDNNNPNLTSQAGKRWIMEGRDSNEWTIIFAVEEHNRGIVECLEHVIEQQESGDYYTVVVYPKIIDLNDASKAFESLCKVLNYRTIIGVSQIITDQKIPSSDLTDFEMIDRLDYFLANGMVENLELEWVKLFSQWEKEKLPHIQIENFVRTFLTRAMKYAPQKHQVSEYEHLLDEAAYLSSSMGEYMAYIWQIIKELTFGSGDSNFKQDSQSYFLTIESYILKNMNEPLTLSQICHLFGLSQTYLSRLFRKYTTISFNEYLTQKRMEKAIELKKANPDILLKDIANLVGYNDPSYFSRVFKNYTGKSPTSFLD